MCRWEVILRQPVLRQCVVGIACVGVVVAAAVADVVDVVVIAVANALTPEAVAIPCILLGLATCRLSLLLRLPDDAAIAPRSAVGRLDRVPFADRPHEAPLLLLRLKCLCIAWLDEERGGRRTRWTDTLGAAAEMVAVVAAAAVAAEAGDPEAGTATADAITVTALGSRLSTRGGGRTGTRTLHTEAVSSIRQRSSLFALLLAVLLLLLLLLLLDEQLDTWARPASLGVGDRIGPPVAACEASSESSSESSVSQSASMPAHSARKAGSSIDGDCRLRVLFEAMLTSL